MSDRFPGIDWYCDRCNAYLNIQPGFESPILKLCKCRKTSQPLCHYIIKSVAVKVKMNVEDNLDSDTFYDFWQLSGCDVVLCRNSGHISKITTGFDDHHYVWKCTECGHKNSISSDSIYESEEEYRNPKN